MEKTNLERAIKLLEEAEVMHGAAVRLARDTLRLLLGELSRGRINQNNGRLKQPLPFVDFDTLSIHWRGSACVLGAGIPLRLFDRLSRRPNCFICHESLLQDVWQGARKSRCTVRSTVRRLKRHLERSGMADLARKIRCEGGSYALMLDERR